MKNMYIISMEKSAYFLGDVHLGVEPTGAIPHRENYLIDFLKSIKNNASHVVLLGDLFEFWYEYKYYVNKNHFKLFYALNDLVQSGVKVFLLKGNHDFAYKDFFSKNLGIPVFNTLRLEIQGKKLFFIHGDGVASSDKNYRIYRRVLNFPLNQFLFSLIHPDWGMALAHFVGKNSRQKGALKEAPLEEYLKWGNSILKKNNMQMCIHGHHHIPGIWNTSSGIVASPGEWIKKLTYLQLEKGELSLNEFKI